MYDTYVTNKFFFSGTIFPKKVNLKKLKVFRLASRKTVICYYTSLKVILTPSSLDK